MIDYLEQLFIPRERMEEGEGGEDPSPFRKAARDVEQVQSLPVPRFRDEAMWQQEAARRLERAVTVPAAPEIRLSEEYSGEMPRAFLSREEPGVEVYPSPSAGRDGRGEREEELEHRLRRNSRRYDSGFFLY